MKQKIITLIIMSMLFMHAVAADAQENIAWSIDNGVLTISGTGDMADYENATAQPWADRISEISRVVIGEGITSIGNWSFADGRGITEIILPESLKEIGERAFYNCSGITHIHIPKNVKTIGSGAFNSCTSAVRVDLPDGLEVIEASAFMNLPKLSSIMIPENVQSIGNWAFFGNTSMAGIYFEGGVPESLGMYMMANADENYTVYLDDENAQEWIKGNYFDKEHTEIYDSETFIPVYLNNSMINFDQQPLIFEGRTLVPVRAIFEAMGAVVGWHEETRTVIAERDGIVIKIPVDFYTMYKNDEPIEIDVPAMIVNQRTLVPVRAISESFGAEVLWNNTERAVYINFR